MDQTARAIVDGAGRPYDERIAMGVRMYLETLASEPGLARAFLHDVLAVGPRRAAPSPDGQRSPADDPRAGCAAQRRAARGLRHLTPTWPRPWSARSRSSS